MALLYRFWKKPGRPAAGLAITGGVLLVIVVIFIWFALRRPVAPILPPVESNTANSVTAGIRLADATALLALLPSSLNGAARTDDNTRSGGAGGIAISTAKGTYHIGDGTVNVTVTDMGTVAGIGAMAAAMNLNTSSSSATGYEKVTTQNGRMVSEKWDNSIKHGEYTIVSDGRISVEAEGDNVDMATLKAVVASVDVDRAKALTQ